MLANLKSIRLAQLAGIAMLSFAGLAAAPAFANNIDFPPISQDGSPYHADAYSSNEGRNCWVQREVYDRQGHPLGVQNVNVCGSSTN